MTPSRSTPSRLFCRLVLWAGVLLIAGAMALVPASATAAPPELVVPRLQQVGDVANCGPTAAAMVLGAYTGEKRRRSLRTLRDRLGKWSWDKFPVRRLSLPGYDAGASTPAILKAMLNKFGDGVTFDRSEARHPWVPQEAWALVTLKANLERGKPVLALVTSKDIWDMPAAGLHWIVVRHVDGDSVVFNDPADRSRSTVPLARFAKAWQLGGIFAAVFQRFTSLVADAPLKPAVNRKRFALR